MIVSRNVTENGEVSASIMLDEGDAPPIEVCSVVWIFSAEKIAGKTQAQLEEAADKVMAGLAASIEALSEL